MESGIVTIRRNKKRTANFYMLPFFKISSNTDLRLLLLLINNDLLWSRYLFKIFWENDRQHPILKTGLYIICKHLFI
ncbi:hypothetical protein QE382_001838 [Sphingobacterium zeae]|uniref:Uncharacterized protein n=1 Tax=Sphingobacterium zeae TaxID=1776859 RepID=A0ABU0U4G9_9SPHI|nr:hypothetical protein [Sphingobacterium zeae]